MGLGAADRGRRRQLLQTHEQADEASVVDYLSFSPDNPSSIRNCIENARLNSRSVRTALTSEMWDTINGAWIDLQEVWGKGTKTREELAKFLRFVQETSLRFDGSAYRTMLRNDAYWFSRLGVASGARRQHRPHSRRQISRAVARRGACRRAARLLPMDLDPALGLGADRLSLGLPGNPQTVADRRPFDPQRFLPRSLASCYGNLVRNLDQIGVAYGRQGAAQRHARGMRNRLEHSNMDDIFQHGVHEFIQEFIADNSRLGEIITKQYLV